MKTALFVSNYLISWFLLTTAHTRKFPIRHTTVNTDVVAVMAMSVLVDILPEGKWDSHSELFWKERDRKIKRKSALLLAHWLARSTDLRAGNLALCRGNWMWEQWIQLYFHGQVYENNLRIKKNLPRKFQPIWISDGFKKLLTLLLISIN